MWMRLLRNAGFRGRRHAAGTNVWLGWVLLLAGSLPAFTACGSSEAPRQAAVREPLRLPTEVAEAAPLPDAIELAGTVRARHRSTVSAQIPAQVKSAPVTMGDRVERGRLLFELDASEPAARLAAARAAAAQAEFGILEAEQGETAARAGLAAAEAQADLAESTYRRFEELHRRGSVSPQEFDEVRSRRDAARGEVERASAMLEAAAAGSARSRHSLSRAQAEMRQVEAVLGHTRITAPFTGVVTAKLVEVGDLAVPGRPLLELESQAGFQLAAEVPESRIGALAEGQTLTAEIPALDRRLTATVVEIQPGADPGSGTFTVKLDLPVSEGLRSGLFGRLSLPLETRPVLTVPESAVVRRGSLPGVFVVDDGGAARFRLLELGRSLQGRFEVLAGLSEGERFVSAPTADLSDGDAVTH